jgi:hypothetical protein
MNEYDSFLRVYITPLYRVGVRSRGPEIFARQGCSKIERVQTRATPDPFEDGRGVFLRGVFSTGI